MSLERVTCRGIVEMSMPSIRMLPLESSSRRKRVDTRVLFPLPLLPQMPILWPALMEREMPSSVGSFDFLERYN